MSHRVAIVGAGLAGLVAAKRLHKAGVPFELIEARGRAGGRILTVDEKGEPAASGFDLGPSWIWPGMQPAIAALVEELRLPMFKQHDEGAALVERSLHQPPVRYDSMPQEPPSMRLVGGTVALVMALLEGLPTDAVWLGTRVSEIALEDDRVRLTLKRDGVAVETQVFSHAVLALPPRLLAATIAFSPAVDGRLMRHWRQTATWMAPHAKFVAVYDRPFWRDAGLSGGAHSMVGPMGEIHDASLEDGRAALFGFLGVPAEQRHAVGRDVVIEACVEQSVRLFGPAAAKPRATLLKDWAADDLTATADDMIAGGHPVPSHQPWVEGVWQARLFLAGSETGSINPGYLAGAVEAGAAAAEQVLQRLGVAA